MSGVGGTIYAGRTFLKMNVAGLESWTVLVLDYLMCSALLGSLIVIVLLSRLC